MPDQSDRLSMSDDELTPLRVLLLRLLWAVIKLVVPIALIALLPPLLGAGLILVLAVLVGLCARLGRKNIAERLSVLLSTTLIGLCIALFGSVPGWWGVVLVPVVLIGGLAALSTYERRLGLSKAQPEPITRDTPATSTSAWSGSDLLTPEGELIRTLDWGELCMGGPTYGSYLFPDGVLLSGLGSSVRFSSGGRYFAAPLPGRDGWGLLILDRQERTVYRHADMGQFWELDSFTDETLIGRCSPLVDNQAYRIALADLLKPELAVPLQAVTDLWLEPGWQHGEPVAERAFDAPAGGHYLRAVRHMPQSLRGLDDPMLPLRYPSYRLQVDDQLSDLMIDDSEDVVWRADGEALVCRAAHLGELRWSRDYWLWQAGQGWRQLSTPWVSVEDEPDMGWDNVLELGEQAIQIEAAFDHAYTNRLGFGYALYHTPSDVEVAIGHDAEGRLLTGEFQRTQVRLVLPLTGEARRGAGEVLSRPLADGQCARFTWQHDNAQGRLGAYACHIADWCIPGEWLLDHRVSGCGRYLALVAFADAPAVPGRVCVVDIEQHRVLSTPQPLRVARLLDFQVSQLSLIHVLGRLSEGEQDTPLRRFDQAAPAAERAARFLERREDSRLFYQDLTLQVGGDELQPLPAWRLVDCPQAANADGDFVLPAPNGHDAAWLFGAESEYRDHYLREHFPRQGGCLLTASGLALANVGPSMIWSADGRYLALTRFIDRMQSRHQVETDQWHLLLLDTQARTLRDTATHIGCMPLFLGFDEDGIEVRTFASDWQVEDDPGDVRRIALTDLLPMYEAPLQARGDLWLLPEELQRAGQWQRLERDHLQAWR